jgi:hypothetical protein
VIYENYGAFCFICPDDKRTRMVLYSPVGLSRGVFNTQYWKESKKVYVPEACLLKYQEDPTPQQNLNMVYTG